MKNTILIISLFLTYIIYGQNSYPQFPNPSLEGISGINVVPAGYTNCLLSGLSSPDIQPGIWNVFLQPSDGNSYVGIICRGNGTWEGFTTQLNSPMTDKNNYTFLIDLSTSNKYFGYNDSAATLKIWGGNSDCDKKKLLWESHPINNINYWRTDTVIFARPDNNITHITFEPGYATSMPYKGNILIDNIRPYYGTIVGIKETFTNTIEVDIYDLLGRKYYNYDDVPYNSIYIKNKQKHLKIK